MTREGLQRSRARICSGFVRLAHSCPLPRHASEGRRGVVPLLLLILLASTANALINPTFTPVELVGKSSAILTCRFLLETNGTVSVDSAVCLKGQVSLPASFTPTRIMREALAAVSGTSRIDAIVFMAGPPPAAETTNRTAAAPAGSFLTTAGWATIRRKDGTAAILSEDSADMKAVWNGSPEMLAAIARDIIAHGTAVRIPATAGVSWETVYETARIDGRVKGCLPVAIGGRTLLFMSCDKGDRLYALDREGALADITAGVGLQTRSDHALWGDLDGDRVPDLMSVAGRTISLYLGGTNRLRQAAHRLELESPCSGLAFIGDADSPAGSVVAPTRNGPVLIALQAGKLAAISLKNAAATDTSTTTGPCLAADFDNDGRGDILQFLENGCLLWRGKGRREFTPQLQFLRIETGDVRCAAVGDYDNDGRLDVFAAGSDGLELLRNRGAPDNFESYTAFSGEPAYAGKPDAAAIAPCDINNDGKEEYILFYHDQGPLPFFARGYFSFGFAKQLDFADQRFPVLQELMRGQQAGAAADLDGDGMQETIVVSRDGRIVVARTGPRQVFGLTVTPGTNAGAAVNVEARMGDISLGARTATAAAPAFFGAQTRGQATLRWRAPDGTTAEKRIPLLRSTAVSLD